jgi:hypothetical protein
MQQWEYLCVSARAGNVGLEGKATYRATAAPDAGVRDFEHFLNELGAQGWELVANTDGLADVQFIFKRPRAAPGPADTPEGAAAVASENTNTA